MLSELANLFFNRLKNDQNILINNIGKDTEQNKKLEELIEQLKKFNGTILHDEQQSVNML